MVSREATREEYGLTAFPPMQAIGQSVSPPCAHFPFTAEFSRIGGEPPSTGQVRTSSDPRTLRARRVADSGAAAWDENPARAGRCFGWPNARRDPPLLSGKPYKSVRIVTDGRFGNLLLTRLSQTKDRHARINTISDVVGRTNRRP